MLNIYKDFQNIARLRRKESKNDEKQGKDGSNEAVEGSTDARSIFYKDVAIIRFLKDDRGCEERDPLNS